MFFIVPKLQKNISKMSLPSNALYLYNCKGFRKQGKKKLKCNDEKRTGRKRNERKDTYLICILISFVSRKKKIKNNET